MTMQSLRCEIDGYPLAASRWPADAGASRTIILLHAGVCDRRSWYRSAELLTDLGTVVAYDRRGFGESRVSPGPYRDLDDLWTVVAQVTAGPVWLVGSSMGGLLALDAAVTAPERVSGLVLLAPAISGAPEPETLEPATAAIFEQLGVARESGDRRQRLQLHARLWLDGPAATHDRVTGASRDLALAMNEVILANDFDDEAGAAGVDAWSQLEQIAVPATVAWGDLDLPAIIEECEQLAARLPRARGQALPGTAHLPYLERPDLVAAVIRQAVTDPPATS
jgi:pimeloyl-ACP methyl ester carboxylesterase